VSTTTQQFDAGRIGQWSDAVEFAVERERTIAYAEATNDTIPQHVEGRYAPPVFAVVAAFEALGPTMAESIPPELLMMVLHGEQDFHFHRPIEPGTTLVTHAVPIGFQGRSSGVTVGVRAETRDKESGDLVVEQYMTSFVRGAQTPEPVGEQAPPHPFPEELRDQPPLAEVSQTFDEDQTFRYSPAAGDPMPIHLDDEVARAMGLPGIIIHGLCTMAFTSRAVIETACPDDPTRLKRLAVRFSKPCRPGETISTRIWDAGEADGRRILAYETTSADSGNVVIKDGRAEIA
jgi:acyl dehydratase